MKIKFEIKSGKSSEHPLYTIFMEHEGEDNIKFLMTRFNLRQLKIGEISSVEKQDIPISDGSLTMSKPNLKKFISALQLLAKS